MPLLFISNVFVPIESPPRWLDITARVFPVRHFSDAMMAVFFDPACGGFDYQGLAIMALWGVGCLVATLRCFSWEPRR
jgi:ABC-2 type transport system permease protein